jgi:hypothetical protein
MKRKITEMKDGRTHLAHKAEHAIDLETGAIVGITVECLSTAGLVKGRTIGIDATTLEANAALRSIVRRDSGESYEEFLTKLAKASGIGTPTRAGDTTTIQKTLPEAAEQLEAVAAVTDDAVAVIDEVVANKGYHSRMTVRRVDVRTLAFMIRSLAGSNTAVASVEPQLPREAHGRSSRAGCRSVATFAPFRRRSSTRPEAALTAWTGLDNGWRHLLSHHRVEC